MARHRKREHQGATVDPEGPFDGLEVEDRDRGGRRTVHGWDAAEAGEPLSGAADGSGRKIFYEEWT